MVAVDLPERVQIPLNLKIHDSFNEIKSKSILIAWVEIKVNKEAHDELRNH